ncbi:hypothetical protein [Ulvibacter litoralis]|uniref:Uncharacterized protein n=1 Tax=Ulvibacter litoralis TaxID=227084 RepID=A0A1G7I224_9FLAO|nr:hypothetical protein [Ulvibacter litoralis]GHC62776.1 hypothetical protein GCM10008083_29980 [Ulvibacter litoralis]SDF06658.1 hypothetical protein SAMN05421855_10553 [Ulvibacter litoralis]
MKKYSIAVALVVTSISFGQSSIKEATQGTETQTQKVKETVKETVKSVKDDKSLKATKKVEKKYTKLEKEELKAAAKRAKEEVKEEAKKAKLQKEAEASKVKSSARQEAAEIKAPSKKTNKATRNNSVKASELKGNSLGQARASEAKQMLELKEIEMTTNDAYIAESRTRISIAEKKLQDQIDAGSLSEEAIVSKKAIVEKAKARLANYEANVKNSKLALRSQKNKIINLYEEQ